MDLTQTKNIALSLRPGLEINPPSPPLPLNQYQTKEPTPALRILCPQTSFFTVDPECSMRELFGSYPGNFRISLFLLCFPNAFLVHSSLLSGKVTHTTVITHSYVLCEQTTVQLSLSTLRFHQVLKLVLTEGLLLRMQSK